jgi:hypothetical protein
MKKRAPPDGRVGKAMAALGPQPAHEERLANLVRDALTSVEDEAGELEWERDAAGLKRYISALRELKASHTALDLSIQWFLKPLPNDIELEIREASIMLEMSHRSRGRPASERVRRAVMWAGIIIQTCGLELTLERKGKWHLLSQVLADTDGDLRHHLKARLPDLLAEK